MSPTLIGDTTHCPTCGAPARYLKIPHPDGEGTTIPLPVGALGGKWYHDCNERTVAQRVAALTDAQLEQLAWGAVSDSSPVDTKWLQAALLTALGGTP